MTPRVPLIFGAAAFGAPNALAARIHDLSDCQEVVHYFLSQGHQVFDTSRYYGNGTSEEYLAKLDLQGAAVDTKSFPEAPGDHSPEKLRATVKKSVEVLFPHKIRVFFLHAPDRSVSYEETLRGVNDLYKEGLFEEFGLSNFYSWEVAEIVAIAKAHEWIQPTVYQGLYNALERNVESELFPCLRKYGIRFHASSPLARGLLAGTNIYAPTPGSRWDSSSSTMAEGLISKYKTFQAAFQELGLSLARHNIPLAEVALRWIQHHSFLNPGDAVIIGASSLQQLQANLKDSEGGPLSEEVLSILDEAWITFKGHAPSYFVQWPHIIGHT
ncbi:hypothetical protein SERLA73DRAFT_77091 [Serpula lacrymans var. lacrymans S7.3]|uniref:NADP-dependent oxidoreductase domain-containing protein n=2 Tax=Serpula lacrymans var. lacrymans TaxID=341189 RepID=F8Q929_SERL3|nr:uncharacterized protein SERLADRAFT_441912 [Serpula lacrymans var. lacrymans S7.9]EGN95084.1 hypothetical protein SERLA73DRAFT_77091 [Serpula lacrymans var. lacrymans S7.3]EGO20573.1 hypothetical protein SERLADRAFT_441912 [Serpula lacrymans var. lacrymans S7.9]